MNFERPNALLMILGGIAILCYVAFILMREGFGVFGNLEETTYMIIMIGVGIALFRGGLDKWARADD